MRRYPYAKYIKIDANTKWEKVKLFTNDTGAKKLKNLGIWFSAGCDGLVKVRFYIDGEPIPTPSKNTDDFYMGDDIRYPIMINKDINPNSLIEIEYTNEDDYAHLIGITWETEYYPIKPEHREEEKKEQEEERKEGHKKERKEEKKESKPIKPAPKPIKKVVKVIPKEAKEVISDLAKELGGGS